MAEWTEMSAREWRSTLPFSAKWAFRPNELFGQMGFRPNTFFGLIGFGQTGFRPNEFRPIEVGSTNINLIIFFWGKYNIKKLTVINMKNN